MSRKIKSRKKRKRVLRDSLHLLDLRNVYVRVNGYYHNKNSNQLIT